MGLFETELLHVVINVADSFHMVVVLKRVILAHYFAPTLKERWTILTLHVEGPILEHGEEFEPMRFKFHPALRLFGCNELLNDAGKHLQVFFAWFGRLFYYTSVPHYGNLLLMVKELFLLSFLSIQVGIYSNTKVIHSQYLPSLVENFTVYLPL